MLLVEAPHEEELERARRARRAVEAGYARSFEPDPAAGDGSGAFDLDAAIRAGLAAGKRASALAKELAPLCDLTRSEVYDRIGVLKGE